MKRILAVLGTSGAALGAGLALWTAAQAAEDAMAPEHHHWHFAGPFGAFDRAALQRGYQVYREVCADCHSMKYLSFRNLGQEGGPFFDEHYPNPNENPVIRALAAEFQISDGPDDSGLMFDRPGIPADTFPSPFPNEPAARLANGGALPPDLSLITKARAHGPDYVRSLLTGYLDPPEDVEMMAGLHYNPWFSGGQIAMAPPLPPDRVFYEDGTEATTEQMAEDVVEFLTWAAEPHAEARKRLGFIVIGYLSILTILLWFSYKALWRGVKH
ncbi:MAG: cytochrome c1 [Maricaulaceae bacterium]